MHKLIIAGILVPQLVSADLVAHYNFDSVGESAGTSFSDEVTSSGVNFATAGSRGVFDQNCRRLGTGCLDVQERGGADAAGTDGAVSNNSFNWGATGYNSDVRTLAFWMKAPADQPEFSATMVSLGSGTANGNRFDVVLNTGALRLELQGGGYTTANTVADDTWHHVAIVVPNATSTLGDVKYYIDGSLEGTMTGTVAVNTGTSPLRMGDTYWGGPRDYTGRLDDVRLYNEALDAAAIAALYNDGVANLPGILCFRSSSTSIVIGESVDLEWEVDPAATSAAIDQGVGDVLTGDPDGMGTTTVSPTTTTTYTMTVVRGAETIEQQITVDVRTSPDIVYLHAVPTTLRDGGSVTVFWETNAADSVTLDDGSGPFSVDSSGFEIFEVSADTTFTLTADLTGGVPAVATTSVDVRSGADPVSYEETILADSPMAYYRFEEPSGCPTLFDHSPNFRDSIQIIGNLDFGQTGAVGNCARFQNAEAVVLSLDFDPQDPDQDDSIGDVDADGQEAWSVEMLARPDLVSPPDDDSQVLLANRDSAGTGRSDLMLNTNSRALASFFGGTNQYGQTPCFDAAWSHIVMVVEYQSSTLDYTIRYYLNGVLDATVPGVTVESSLGAWVLGSHKNQQSGSFFEGLMDEVSFYDYALDDPNADGDLADSKVPAHFSAYLQDAAPLLSFGSTTRYVRQPGTATLSLIVGDSAQTVSIDQGVGPVTPVNGAASVVVNPTGPTTYTLTVNDGTSDFTSTFSVTGLGPLAITSAAFNENSEFVLSAENLMPGLAYRWVRTGDLADWDHVNGSAVLLDSFTPATTASGVTDLAPPAGSAFYRLEETTD